MSEVEPVERPVPMTNFEKRFKHPPGLFILFFAEMWERFSYYGMRGLLRLYMTSFLFVTARQALQGCSEADPPCTLIEGDPSAVWLWDLIKGFLPEQTGEQASVLYGIYTGLVYLTPLLGGFLADRFIGQRRSVVVGALLMATGQFILAFENAFFVGLMLLIIGNGFFKPNISTQVGSLYPEGDPRRDGAFTIFYMGINIGAFICNFVCGTLAAVYGWKYGFGAAGVGMLIGLTVYLVGQKYLAPDNLMKIKAAKEAAAAAKAAGEVKVAEKKGLTSDEWKRVAALIGLCALNVVFWMVYEQQGNTMQDWADKKTEWPVIFGWQIPSTWYQSFNPMIIFMLAPLLDMFWRHQAKKGTEPTSVTKMAIGSVLLGLSFILMIIGANVIGDGKGSLFWPLACTFVITVGELYLSPIGLSLVTKVSPVRIVSLMMGMWFLSSFFGNILSGLIGVYYERWPKELFFTMLMAFGLVTGIVMFIFNRPLKRILKH
ncbi:MAG: peptide MFS transporter [Myxococcales bacterium]|nr:peptide MFS transporter [Myxococcales bacterium]